MNKKIIYSMFVIGVVSSIGLMSTRALFSDSKTKAGSAFTIGTLELDVKGANGSDQASVSIDDIGLASDLSGERSWVVYNKGSIPGRLYLKLANLKNLENLCNEPESRVDNSCDDSVLNSGDLGKILDVKFYVDDSEKLVSTLGAGKDSEIEAAWKNLDAIPAMPGQSVNVKMVWSADPDSFGNEIQSDSVSFDLVFDLVQLVTQ